MDTVLILAGVIVGFVALWVAAQQGDRWIARRRSVALTELASSLGFTIAPERVLPRLTPAIAGRAGEGRVVVLDFQYVEGSGQRRRTVFEAIVAVELAGEPLPAFVLGRRKAARG